VLALLRWDTYECIHETLEILADEQLSKDLAVGIQQINKKSDLGKEDKVLHHLQRLLQAGLADSWTKPILRLISNSRYPDFSF